MNPSPKLPPEVAERLGPYYVYALVDPRDDTIFYVGKGTGQRLLAHGLEADIKSDDRGNRAKLARIRDIRASGTEPRLDVVRHGLEESDAFMVEAALIDCLPGLTNAVAGHGRAVDRRPLWEYVVSFGAQPVPEDAPPAVLVRLGRWRDDGEQVETGYRRSGAGYSPDRSLHEIVDATRAWWRINPDTIRRREIRHAVAVHEGVTRAIMTIGAWSQRKDGRRAFEATPITDGPVYDAWVGTYGRRVPFASNSQNPITYWPVRAS